MSDDEQCERGYFELDDPRGNLPTKCSYCGRTGSVVNPLRFDPVSRDGKNLARQYLYRSKCRYCEEFGPHHSRALLEATGQ
jgi:rRNA maturation protein Nop10